VIVNPEVTVILLVGPMKSPVVSPVKLSRDVFWPVTLTLALLRVYTRLTPVETAIWI
jgi:hypothetical protein